MTLSDVGKFIASTIVFHSAILLWIRYTATGSRLFDFHRAFSSKVAVRISFVHIVIAFFFCIVGKMSANELAAPIFVYLIAVLISLLLLQKADTFLIFEPALIILVPSLVIWLPAWALGSFVLAPARRPLEHNVETSQLSFPPLPISDSQIEAGTIVVVVSPLKPFGFIELDGQRIAASCLDNGFVETGEKVRLHRRAGQAVIVKRIATDI
jgi:membrane protein implicated in regulation of membrane protease activity